MCPTIADQWHGWINKVCSSGETLTVLQLIGGVCHLVRMRLSREPGMSDHVIIVVRPPVIPGFGPHITAAHHDFGPLIRLTPREFEVFALLGRGLSMSDIAKHVSRSEKTIESRHIAVGCKLNEGSRTHIVVRSIRQGLGTPPDEGIESINRSLSRAREARRFNIDF